MVVHLPKRKLDHPVCLLMGQQGVRFEKSVGVSLFEGFIDCSDWSAFDGVEQLGQLHEEECGSDFYANQ